VTFADAVARLEAALARGLPGAAAQERMAPVPRRQWPAGFNVARVRHAAGLLLLFPGTTIDAERAEPAEPSTREILRALRSPSSSASAPAHIVLTVRGDTPRHAGQVSLPGGVVEPGETFEQAALREAHEEVALDVSAVRVIGALTPLDIPVSGFRLYPVVGTTDAKPCLTPADGEVAHILDIALQDLLDPARTGRSRRERDGIALTVPAFRIGDHEIWGATAMVLAEFLTLLGWQGPRQS
jgi:8-oxo-dGTP pyrophosphatase MutT (NUDIX family)